MTDHSLTIERETQALVSLNSSITPLFDDSFSQSKLLKIVERKLFTPAEDEEIAYWFARYITLRSNLWVVVDTSIINTGGMLRLATPNDWRFFVIGYSAVCSLIRLDRFLLTKVAIHATIQRKLNEAFPAHRIERKQYSRIYSQMTMPSNVIRIHHAHQLLAKNRIKITNSVKNTPVEPVFASLHKQERYLDLSKRHYLIAWLRNRFHALKRRGASAKQKSLFRVLEYSGRVVSELMLPRPKKVTQNILSQANHLLQPGDILITRHKKALTNLFFPGYWPHAALYVGSESEQNILNVDADPQHLKHWTGDTQTFEALKDGVHFRSLADTLAVDAFVVVRPNLTKAAIAEAISRVVVHVGKGYNFDFDFFRSDHLVCTELIYRAYDEVEGYSIPLQDRMGRKTLSAEDILDLALDTNWANPIAIFGVGKSRKELVTHDVKPILTQSYRTHSRDLSEGKSDQANQ